MSLLHIISGNKEQLVNPNTNIEGRAPKIVNSITLASNGDIYWTDSSTDFHLEDGVYSFLADGTGRWVSKILINFKQTEEYSIDKAGKHWNYQHIYSC